MARDLMDDTYYTSSGGKIPIKWTAPEVRKVIFLYFNSCYGYFVCLFVCLFLKFVVKKELFFHYFRLYCIRNIPQIVMCGAMVWCCLKSGLWLGNLLVI